MFTGLVETMGTLVSSQGSDPRRLCIQTPFAQDGVHIGDSVALDGCCLTVVEIDGDTLSFEAATETLKRTTLGQLQEGARVNLERPLRVGDRLGGHMVSGHVDGVARVSSVDDQSGARYVSVEVPKELAHFVASQGSITLAGVSLTVTQVEGRQVWVGLIPHTLEVTNLKTLQPGDPVNVEVDLVARYVYRLLAATGDDESYPAALQLLRSKTA